MQRRCQRCGDLYLVNDEWDDPDYCLDCFEWLQDHPNPQPPRTTVSKREILLWIRNKQGIQFFVNGACSLFAAFAIWDGRSLIACAVAFAAIAVGLLHSYLQPQYNIGPDPRLRSLDMPPSCAYQDALRPLGRNWNWLGAMLPLVITVAATVAMGPATSTLLGRYSLEGLIFSLVVIAVFEWEATYFGAWGFQGVYILRHWKQERLRRLSNGA